MVFQLMFAIITPALIVAATIALAAVGTFIILGIIKSVVGLRVEEDDEAVGLDLSLHAEAAYTTASSGSPIGERTPRRPSPTIPPSESSRESRS
jgi:ammonia channel protein AmtB